MYDHNQIVVPDSFMALHSSHGRATLSRAETEARYEICEDLALHTAAFLEGRDLEPADVDSALRQCHDGLRVEPIAISAAEADWVIERVAELQGWPRPGWLAEPSEHARP